MKKTKELGHKLPAPIRLASANRAPTEPGSWFVYGLYDSRRPAEPFYVGYSAYLGMRASSHFDAPCSKALAKRFRDIEKAGAECHLRALFRYRSAAAAIKRERYEIERRFNLLNSRGTA